MTLITLNPLYSEGILSITCDKILLEFFEFYRMTGSDGLSKI